LAAGVQIKRTQEHKMEIVIDHTAGYGMQYLHMKGFYMHKKEYMFYRHWLDFN
jgi:uncharacterized membrane-anchored protein YitT (DUF2179 family)